MLSRRLLRIKAIQSLYAAVAREDDSAVIAEKEITGSSDQCYLLYLELLSLIVAVKDYAAERIEIGLHKFKPTEAEKNPNRRFVENPVIAQIEEALEPEAGKLPVDWAVHKEIVARLYNELVSEDYFSVYMKLLRGTYQSAKRVLTAFISGIVVDDQQLEKVLEDASIFWIDDIDYAASFVCTTINDAVKDQPVTLLEKYTDSDVEQFGRLLVRRAFQEMPENTRFITRSCHHWDFGRIAMMDRIILLTAVAEFRNFESIPVKVTIDEYIEISKYYSSEESPTFINGVLDKIAEQLTEEGLIRKTGRGLIQQ